VVQVVAAVDQAVPEEAEVVTAVPAHEPEGVGLLVRDLLVDRIPTMMGRLAVVAQARSA
jgi:hypothetical protein